MCFLIYLSTTSPEDLRLLPSKLYHLLPLSKEDDPAIANLLENPSQWFI
jgi:hypothetical protein